MSIVVVSTIGGAFRISAVGTEPEPTVFVANDGASGWGGSKTGEGVGVKGVVTVAVAGAGAGDSSLSGAGRGRKVM
jgi:hypothetical protein